MHGYMKKNNTNIFQKLEDNTDKSKKEIETKEN